MAFSVRACVYPSASSSTDHEAQVTCPNLSATLVISRDGTGQNQLLIPEPVPGSSGAKVDKCRPATRCNRAICLFNRRMLVCHQTVCMPPHSQQLLLREHVSITQCMPLEKYNDLIPLTEMAPATPVGYYAPRAPNVVRVQAMPLQQVPSSHLLGSCLRHLRYSCDSVTREHVLRWCRWLKDTPLSRCPNDRRWCTL